MARQTRGDRVGKYELLAPLTSGGMAELYLGSTIGPGGFQKHVVIKRILPDASRDETFVRMFLDEARITAGFSHPNIVQVFDLGQDDEGLFVVMEFVPGQNLNQVVSVCAKKQHVLPLGFSVSVLTDCANALHYAHTYVKPSGERYPVVHRDVAQKNIMVGWDGQTKLLDFGIAKAAGTLSRTKVGTVKGTAGYMSPEQVKGLAVDGRSDVFSLGVVFWEMVTGQRLFSAETELAEMKMILETPIVRPEEVEPVVPTPLSDIIMRALAREPSDRWPNAKELARAISSRCPELLYDAEERSQFMRELFADRIEQTRKLFELSGSKSDAKPAEQADARVTKEQEVRALARSLQESAMSQPVLKPVKGRAKPGPKKAKQRTAEDDKLLELAIKVDQAAMSADEQKPKRAWGGLIVAGLVLVLLAATTNKLFFAEKRRSSSSGLVLWDGEPDEPEGEKPTTLVDVPTKPTGPSAHLDAIPGSDSNPQPPADGPEVDTTPIALPPQTPPEKEPQKPPVTVKKSPPLVPSGPPAEVVLALLPTAKVSRGKEVLGEGSLVKFNLPTGTHLLTIEGPDGVKRQLSVQASAAKKTVLKFTVADLPAK